MKKLIAVSILLIFFNSSILSQTNKSKSVVLYYDNDTKQNIWQKGQKEFYKGYWERTGRWTVYNEEGKKKIVENYVHGENHGLWTKYHENGLKEAEGYYKKGRIYGEWTVYHPNGNVYLKGNFNFDENPVGTWTVYWEDGTPAKYYYLDNKDRLLSTKYAKFKFENNFKYLDGRIGKGKILIDDDFKPESSKFATRYNIAYGRTGSWTIFYPTGELESKGNYKTETDNQIGYWQGFYKNGNLKWEKNFDDKGKTSGILKDYYENGNLKWERNTKNGEITDISRGYYENGKIKYEHTYSTNEIIDKYYEGGYERYLKTKVRLCNCNFYYKNGSIRAKGHRRKYKVSDSKDYGEWKFYFENGQIKSRYNYDVNNDFPIDQYLKDGTQILSDGTGEYRTYYKLGQLRMSSHMKKGCRDGITTWYYKNGQVQKSAVYKYSEKLKPYGLRWEVLSTYTKDGKALNKGTLKNGTGTWIEYDEDGNRTKVYKYTNGYSEN